MSSDRLAVGRRFVMTWLAGVGRRARGGRPRRRARRAMARSSSTRWAHVWRARIVARPRSASSAARARLGEEGREVLLHLVAVPGDEVVTARREQPLRVAPRRADERDGAGHGLERPDGRDPRERVDVGPPRDVDCHPCPRERLGSAVVREPAPVLDPAASSAARALLGVAHPVDAGGEAEIARRADQERVELAGALLVAPVADPTRDRAPAGPRGAGGRRGRPLPRARRTARQAQRRARRGRGSARPKARTPS